MPADPALVQRVFRSASVLPPEARPAHLAEACEGDDDLRAAVERLLAAHDSPATLAQEPGRYDASRTTDRAGTEIHEPGPDQEPDVLAFLTPALEPGSLGRLDHYVILGVVGRGGMGVVLKARDTKLQRVVAVKAPAPALAVSGTARRRFVREAQAAAAIRDEHVVSIHAVREDGPAPYLVMEFSSGMTLEDRIKKGGPVDPKEVLRVGIQAARGLAAAHAPGLVHRDVKPANILLENGVQRVKLTDFGLARAVDDASLTQTGVLAGTPLSMSPEQARGEPVDHRTDLFSLGSVLYTLCAGRPAFRAGNTAAVLKRVCDETPRPNRETNPDVPTWLCGAVAKLRAKGPADRFQSAAEVADLLGKYLAHLQRPDQVAHPAPLRKGRGKPFAVAAVGLAVLVGGVWAFLARSGGRETNPMSAPGPVASVAVKAAQVALKPKPPPTPDELAKLPSPFDGRVRSDVDPDLLALAGADGPDVVAVLGGVRPFSVPGSGQVLYPAQSRDGRRLALPRGSGEVVFDAKTGRVLHVLAGPAGRTIAVEFSPEGRPAAAAVTRWDAETGVERPTLTLTNRGSWLVYGLSPDGKTLFSMGADQAEPTLYAFDAETAAERSPPTGYEAPSRGLAFSPDGRTLAVGGNHAAVSLVDVASGWEVGSVPFGGRVRWIGFNPDGRSLAVAGWVQGNEVLVWDLARRSAKVRLKGHQHEVIAGAWRSDGRLLVTAGSGEGRVGVWDLNRDPPGSEVIRVVAPGVQCLHGIALTPEGRHVVTANPDGTMDVLRLAGKGQVYGGRPEPTGAGR